MKSNSYKLSKSQALAGFLEEERAEELDIITAAMTKEQHIAALEAGGMSREAQDAFFEKQNQKLREILAKQPAPENVVPIRRDVVVVASPLKPKRSLFTRRDVKVGGAFAAVAAAATYILQTMVMVAPVAGPLLATGMVTGSAPPSTPAAALREEAYAACHAELWQKCIDALDRAKAIDPLGDVELAAQGAREKAMRGLHR